jgi:hypothetical protein
MGALYSGLRRAEQKRVVAELFMGAVSYCSYRKGELESKKVRTANT